MSDSLSILIQNIFSGVAIGGVYSLIALGMALIYRSTGVTNFAQGDLAMIGAYMLFTFSVMLDLPYLLAFILALVAMGIFGYLFQKFIYYPLRNRSFLAVIIATIGAGIMFQNGILAIFGSSPKRISAFIETADGVGGLTLGGVYFDYQYIIILVITILLVIAQYALFEYTSLGKKMQATAQDKTMTQLLGIPVALMIGITFIYSTLLGGLSGMLMGPIFFVTHRMGVTVGLKAFAAGITGGFGDVRGAIIGGIAIGLIETLGASYISPVYRDAYPFLLVLIFLLVRPQGIFGEKVSEKA